MSFRSAARQTWRPLHLVPNVAFALLLVLASTVVASAQQLPSIDSQGTHGMSPRDKILITSTKQLNLDTGLATVPIFQGHAGGMSVWFVLTDVSDQGMAREMGLNFAPRLKNISVNCPGCAMTVQSGSSMLGHADVTFPARPDFSPERVVVPSATGFPPLQAVPGAMAMPGYSDFVRIQGSDIVWNAPIIATGDGPFDISGHTNIHDRVARIDTTAMEADMLVVRAFSGGRNITYHSFSASDPLTAALERVTFEPGLSGTCCVGGSLHPGGVRTAIFGFVNGKRGNDPHAQGLMHLVLDGLNPRPTNPQDHDLSEALRTFGDLRNVLDTMTTFSAEKESRGYTPVWDLHLGEWSPAAVAAGMNTARSDANDIRNLVAEGMITGPGGTPFGPANVVINCPQLSFLDDSPPTGNRPADPGARQADDGNRLSGQPPETQAAFLSAYAGDMGAANSGWVDQHDTELEQRLGRP